MDKLSGIIYIAIVFKSLCKGAQQIKHTPTQTKLYNWHKQCEYHHRKQELREVTRINR